MNTAPSEVIRSGIRAYGEACRVDQMTRAHYGIGSRAANETAKEVEELEDRIVGLLQAYFVERPF